MQNSTKHYRVTERAIRDQLEGQYLTNDEVQKQNLFFGLGLGFALLNGILIGLLANKK